MQVAVQFHGAAPGGATRLTLELPATATAGELIDGLAAAGLPLAEFAGSREPRLSRRLRVFAGAALLAWRDQRVAPREQPPNVTVVLMTPIAGG